MPRALRKIDLMPRARSTMLFALMVLLAPAPTTADTQVPAPSRADVQTARKHFHRGRPLVQRKKYAEAIAAFEEAYRLDPRSEHLYNLGVAHHLKGDLEKAAEYYRRYLAERSTGATARKAAQYVKVIEAQLAARKAGTALPEPAPKSDPLRDAIQRAEAAEAELVQLRAQATQLQGEVVTGREAAAAAEQRAALQQRQAARWRADALAAPSGEGRVRRIAGGGLMAAGAAALAAGAVYGWSARQASDELSSAETWSPAYDELIDKGEAADRRVKVLLPVGGAAILAGASIYLWGELAAKKPRRRAAVEVAPAAGGGQTGLVVRGAF